MIIVGKYWPVHCCCFLQNKNQSLICIHSLHHEEHPRVSYINRQQRLKCVKRCGTWAFFQFTQSKNKRAPALKQSELPESRARSDHLCGKVGKCLFCQSEVTSLGKAGHYHLISFGPQSSRLTVWPLACNKLISCHLPWNMGMCTIKAQHPLTW